MLNLIPLRHDLRPINTKIGINTPIIFLSVLLHNIYYGNVSER